MNRASAFASVSLLLAGLSGLAGPAPAQVLRGVVVDDPSGAPMPGASVVLLDSAGRQFKWDETRDNGAFRFAIPRSGQYMVLAQRMGYTPLLTPLLEVGEDSLEVELRVLPKPVSLPGVGVTVERQRLRLNDVGFYDRRDLGIGRFITQEEVTERAPERLTDVLRMEPSVDVKIDFESPTGTGYRVVFRDAQRGFRPEDAGNCFPAVVVDDRMVRRGGKGGLPLDELVHPAEVSALELYPSGAGVPARWSGTDAFCGVIMVWTKRRQP